MKKVLIASILVVGTVSAAYAADLRPPLKAAPPPAPVALPPTWTGYYIGGNIGYAWGNDAKTTTGTAVLGGALNPGTATLHPNGGFSGLQSGYNWQIAPTWLVGYESDFQYGKIKGSAGCLVTCGVQPIFPFANYQSFSVTDRLNWFGTVRGRIGYVADPVLLYFTGGLAYGQVEREANLVGSTNPFPGGFGGQYDNTKTKVGWTIGGGLEAKLSNWLSAWTGMPWTGWTAKAEYLYIDLGHFTDTLNESYVSGFPGAVRTVTGSIRENIFRVGLNYQFNAAR